MPSILNTLAPALIQTFATIVVGYVFGRFKLIPPDGIKAMGAFVTMLALPALLLRNMATLDLKHIEWDFFLALLFGKSLLFASVVIIALLKNGCSKKGMSDAGVFAIFVSQSNDFAMGLPILEALFGHTHPTFPGLLYVISPISLIILNPIGIVLMEYGRQTPDEIDAEKSANGDVEDTQPVNDPLVSPLVISSQSTDKLVPAASASSSECPLKTAQMNESSSPSLQSAQSVSCDHESRLTQRQRQQRESVANLLAQEDVDMNGSIDVASLPGRSIDQILNSSSDDESDSEDADVVQLNMAFAQDGHGISIAPIRRGPGDQPAIGRLIASIMLRVFKNPVVMCSIGGILFNLALGGKIPVYVDGFLLALGNTFSGLALFVLGVNMNGKLQLFQDRRKLFLPLLLIAAKSIALPILVRLFIASLGVDGLSDLTMCAFLVGTLPPAPSTHFFAVQSGAWSTEIIAPSMVLGTFIAAPIMFISAQMVTIQPTIEDISVIVSDSSRIAAGFGFLGAAYCIICFIYNRRWKSTRERLLITLLVFQTIYTLSLQFCLIDFDGGVGEVIRFWFVLGSTYGLYLTSAAMAINEIVRRYHGYKAEHHVYRWYNIVIVTLIILLVGSLQLFGVRSDPEMEFEGCYKRYGKGQWIVTMVLICSCFIVIVSGLVKLRGNDYDPNNKLRNPSHASSEGDKDVDGSTSSFHADLQANLLDHDYEIDSSEGASSERSFNLASPSPNAFGLTPVDPFTIGVSERTVSQSSVNGIAIPTEGVCPYASQGLHNGNHRLTQCEVESFWMFAMKIQLFLSASSLFLFGALSTWSNDTNGIWLEMVLLDQFLFSSMGVYTLGLFGLSRNIISPLRPLKRSIRRCLFSKSRVVPPVSRRANPTIGLSRRMSRHSPIENSSNIASRAIEIDHDSVRPSVKYRSEE